MSYRFLAVTGAIAILFAASLHAQTPRAAKLAAAKGTSGSIPRTPNGHPDLQGVWTNAIITPMERPSAFAPKPTLTDAEAVEFEKQQAQELQDVDGKSNSPLLAAAGSNGTGG